MAKSKKAEMAAEIINKAAGGQAVNVGLPEPPPPPPTAQSLRKDHVLSGVIRSVTPCGSVACVTVAVVTAGSSGRAEEGVVFVPLDKVTRPGFSKTVQEAIDRLTYQVCNLSPPAPVKAPEPVPHQANGKPAEQQPPAAERPLTTEEVNALARKVGQLCGLHKSSTDQVVVWYCGYFGVNEVAKTPRRSYLAAMTVLDDCLADELTSGAVEQLVIDTEQLNAADRQKFLSEFGIQGVQGLHPKWLLCALKWLKLKRESYHSGC